jgi:hypothetical protein
MSDELLERATRALAGRYTPEKASSEAEAGLRELVRDLAGVRARRRRWQIVALIAAASLVGITAWATATGRLARWGGEEPPDVRALGAPPEPHASLEMAPDASPLDLPPSAESAPLPVPDPAPSAAPHRPAAAARAQPVPAASAAPPDLDALYREAHEAHFVRRDPAAALAAWDRYIALAGSEGRMTLEARYHRAVALVRLGRNEDARTALEPFARGEFGGYRQDEARRLLQSLH